MKAEYHDGMLPEYDFSTATRGKFADRWSPEQREQIARESVVGTARAWHEFVLTRVQRLEAALFSLLVLGAKPRRPARASARPYDARPSHALGKLIRDLEGNRLLPDSLGERLHSLAHECEWLVEHGGQGAEGSPTERRAHVERLERIGREAERLTEESDILIRQRLELTGLSVQEIERRTEETARLWLAA